MRHSSNRHICWTWLSALAAILLFTVDISKGTAAESASEEPAAENEPVNIEGLKRQLSKSPDNPRGLYNLGVLFARDADWVKAKIALESAFTLWPSSSRIRASLHRLDEQLEKTSDTELVEADSLTWNAFYYASWLIPIQWAFALFVGLWILFSGRLFRRFTDRTTTARLLTAAGLLVGTLGLAGYATVAHLPVPERGVIQTQADPRVGPSNYASTAGLQLAPGSTVFVTQRRSSWTRIQLPDGESYWIPNDVVVPVEDPDQWLQGLT